MLGGTTVLQAADDAKQIVQLTFLLCIVGNFDAGSGDELECYLVLKCKYFDVFHRERFPFLEFSIP